jgi:hypothetical protein
MLTTIAERLPGLEVTGPPAKLRTLSSNGIKHLPVRLLGTRPGPWGDGTA